MHSSIHLCIHSANMYYISPMCEGPYWVIESYGKQYRHKFFFKFFFFFKPRTGSEIKQKNYIKITQLIPQICKWHHLYDRKWKGTKESLDEGERGEWKAGLKLNIQKMKIMASDPISLWQIDGETMDSDRLYFLGLQNHCRWWLQP